MKNSLKLSIVFLILGCLSFTESKDIKNQLPIERNLNLLLSKSNIPFIFNKGQIDDSVLYYAQIFRGHVYVTKTGKIVYSFLNHKNKHLSDFHNSRSNQKIDGLVIRETFINGNEIRVSCEGLTQGLCCMNRKHGHLSI